MKEDFLHYLWKQELFEKKLKSVYDDSVEIISTGIHNTDSGPDFLNARIKINNTLWAGNVEIHTVSDNWEKHKHHKDPAYNNVILHVVGSYIKPAIRQNGGQIPTIVLNYDNDMFDRYQQMVDNEQKIACEDNISSVDEATIKMWLESLCIERLEEKTEYIKNVLNRTNNNWEETFYNMLAKNFGFKTNSLPFEMLAKSIPLKVISKYSNNINQLEALLFGQAGFLNNTIENDYHSSLKKEYIFLKKAHKLTPLDIHLWKFLRLRPSNFPTIRIAQFADLVFKSKHLFSKTLEIKDISELFKLYSCSTSKFWTEHYNFNKPGKKKEKPIGKTALCGLFINTVIPFLFIYGKNRGKPELMEKAINLLNEIPSESNSIINLWNKMGVKCVNSAQSQAIIQLTNKYCINRNCLYCQIGNAIIRNETK